MSLGAGSVRAVGGLGDGGPLAPSLRGRFERAFDADLSRVRIHTGEAAAAAAADAGARAFTLGDDVVFGTGAYRPGSGAGDWLIGHELAHVAQTRAGAGAGSEAGIEADARASATAALLGLPARPQQAHDGRQLRRFGRPENVPDLTYISTQAGPGFLNQANAYHRAWGLNPRRVASMEEIVAHLARGRGRVGRVRIVAHAAQLGPYMSLFRRQPLVSLQAARLRAWATSDVAGLNVDLGYPFGQITAAQRGRILTHLRTNHAAKIAPFNLGAAAPPTGALAELLQRATDLELLTQSRTATNAAQIDPLIAATRTILADIRGRVATQGSITPVQAQALETAIRGAGLLSTGYTPTAHQTGTVREANRAVAGGFRATLGRARARFDADSWIDLRGCNAGGNRANLVALQEFFGRPNDLPHVSAPDWFQQFLVFAYASLGSDAAIDAAMADASFAAALSRWAVITGIRAEVQALRLFYTAALARRAVAAAAPPATTGLGLGGIGGAGGLSLGGGLSRGPFPRLSLGASLTVPRIPLPQIPVTSSTADRILVDLILRAELGALSRLQVPPLRSPRFTIAPNLALADPLTPIVRRALASLMAPTGEARFYFHSPHVLPVYRAGIQSFRFYYLQRLREGAFDRWLDSQWTSAPRGLRAIKRQAATQTNPRRIQAVVPQRNGGLDQMLFPPDPRYWQHIIRI